MNTFTQRGHAVTLYVCSVCGRTCDEYHTSGWLIGLRNEPERAANGEMMIRCPAHVTRYAKRSVAK